MAEWQPIKSAPRDGTKILIRPKNPHWAEPRVVRWATTYEPRIDGFLWSWVDDLGRYAWHAFEWMPLPDPSSADASDREVGNG